MTRERGPEQREGSRSVAVIGAGWAGLAAAVELAQRGIPVTVFEAARYAGGRARRVTLEGVDLDNGQHILIGAYTESLRLMRAVGADPDLLLARFPLTLRVEPGFSLTAPRLPAPLHLIAGLLGARGLSWPDRFAALRFALVLRRTQYRVDAGLTVAALLERHAQHGTLRTCLWEPLCIAALNTPISRASAQVFANVLRDSLGATREAADLLLPRCDLGALFPLPAVAWLRGQQAEVRLGTPVRHIERHGGGFVLDADPRRFTHVVIAVSPHHATALTGAFPELAPAHAALLAFAYEPIYTCYLQYASAALPFPMIGLRGMVQWVLDRGALGGPKGLLAAVISASGPHQALALDALAVRAHEEVRAVFPELGAPRWSRVIAERRATFSCIAGLSRPAHRTALDGLLLAGDYTASDYPSTLEAAVRSGVAAARLI